MNRLSDEQRVRVLAALVDGASVRATCRMTGAAKGTVLKLLAEVGTACAEYQRRVMVNLPCERLEADEIWSFVGSKQANTEPMAAGLATHVWSLAEVLSLASTALPAAA